MRSKPSQSAVVVTGTPGTGKTTVSRSLARQLNADYLSLTKLVIGKGLRAAEDQQRRTSIVDLDRTRAWLRNSLRESDKVRVIDTHVADAVPREYVAKVIVLRCHPKLLEARLRRKGWGLSKVRENVLAEILDSCYITAVEYYGSRKTFELDTSRTSITKTLKQSRTLLKQLPRKHKIDWITALGREHVIERYLP